MKFLFSFLLLFLAVGNFSASASTEDLKQGFAAPPDSAAAHVWWDWINGNVTKEGVTADFEAMQRVGIRSATIVVLTGGPAGPVPYASRQFTDMVKFAASEAKRLGITVGLENCTGWSSSGAPWVTPENSMLTVTSSEKAVQGPATFTGQLDQPPTRRDFYKDIRVVAFPAVDGGEADMAAAAPTVTSSAPGFQNAKSGSGYQLPYVPGAKHEYIQFAFGQPYEVRTLQIAIEPSAHASGDFQASDDGETFHTIRSFGLHERAPFRDPDLGEVETFALPVTSAKVFRVVFTSSGGRGKMMSISRISLLPGARLDGFLGKSDGTEQRLMLGSEFENLQTPTPPDTMVVHADKIVDLTSKMDATGKLAWDVPPGKWTVLRFGYTTTGVSNHPGPPEGTGLECGKLSRAAGKAFWDGLMSKVATDLGPLTGTGFTHTLIDSYEVGNQNWTPEMPQEFQKRCGYDLLTYLPVFAGYIVESPDVSDRVLWDFRHTVADLFAENYYDYFAQLSHESGIELQTEPYGNGPFDAIRSGRDADRVMGEFWWPSGDTGSLRIAASVAHTQGKSVAGAESFTSDIGAWQMSPPTMKMLGDLAFTNGINGFTFHRYVMQRWQDRYPGMAMGHNGSNLERTVTWWEQGRAWLKYLARSQYLLQQGVFVGDALFFEGEAPPTEPSHPPASALPAGYDFDWCDTDVILKRLSVKDGNLILPNGGSYRVLVLPPKKKITPLLLRKLKELADAGATIIGPKPEQSPGLMGYPGCDDEVKKLAADLWDGGKIVDKPLPEVLSGLKVPRDFEPADSHVKLVYIHRRIGNDDLYFVSNQSDYPQETEVLFRVSGKVPEFWHADTGSIEKVAAYSEEDGRTRIPLRLDPAGSIFVLFRGGQTPPADHPASWARTDQTAAASAGTLTINQATFGALEGTPSTDVTSRLAPLVRDGELHVDATPPNLGGDPAPGLKKQLRVDYMLNGKVGTITVAEGKGLDIAPSKPLFPETQLHAGEKVATLEAWQSGTYAVKMASGQDKTVPVTGLASPSEIAGPWALTFPPNWGAPPKASFDKLISWSDSSDDGIKYFSGTATYTKTLNVPAGLLDAGHHLYLDLGNVQVIAEVKLNGQDLGILWKTPYAVEITGAAHEGDNALEVKVTNLWPNRIIGDQQLPEDSKRDANGWLLEWPQFLLDGKPSPTGRLTFGTWRHYKKDDPLFPSGLIGPVMLRPSIEVPLP